MAAAGALLVAALLCRPAGRHKMWRRSIFDAHVEHRLRAGIGRGPKIMTVFAEIAEFEHDRIGDRTSVCHEMARRRVIRLAHL